MIYTIKYKCEPFSTICDDVAILRIKYRPQGGLKWTRISKELWDFAERIYGNEYYDSYKYDLYGKLLAFQKIIDERYDGSLEKYVEDIVRYDVLEKKADQADMEEAAKIIIRFETKGWRTQTIEIGCETS